MKRLKKILLGLMGLVIISVLLVMGLRYFNQTRYKTVEQNLPIYLKNPRDISAYPNFIDGISIKYIDQNSFQGFQLTPQKKSHKGVIICFGGSEGSPNFPTALELAKEGYETFAVFMFGMSHQPSTLSRIPLEQFNDILSYLEQQDLKDQPITIYAASKGAEYALNLATKYPAITSLILMSPSAYNFSGLDFSNPGSSWTWQGSEIPFVDIQKSNFIAFVNNMLIPSFIYSPVSYKESYQTAVDNDPNAEAKLIPVKKTQASILLIAGEDDQMWDSAGMAQKIKELNPEHVQVLTYTGAGHIFYGNGLIISPDSIIRTGGTEQGNQNAQNESYQAVIKFLDAHHPLE